MRRQRTSRNFHPMIAYILVRNLQQDIIDVLMRIRIPMVALTFVTSDKSKMYRQILINELYHTHLYTFGSSSPLYELCEYELCIVTYGMECTPYLALRVLRHIPHHGCSIFSNIKSILIEQTYIDDILCIDGDLMY